MTDNEIIKALECCLNEDCDNCPNCCGCYCIENLMSYALDYIRRQREQLEATIAGQETLQKSLAEKDREINRGLELRFAKSVDLIASQQEDIERLKSMNQSKLDTIHDLQAEIARLTAEKDSLIKTFGECQAVAIREFAKRLKEECLIDRGYEILQEGTIDNLVKEIVGEQG